MYQNDDVECKAGSKSEGQEGRMSKGEEITGDTMRQRKQEENGDVDMWNN